MIKNKQDMQPIVACVTASGLAGVSIVRVSGHNSLDIVKKSLKIKKEIKPRYAEFCSIKVNDINDDVLLIYFKSPNSFTGEDVVEVQCHANSIIVENIIKCIIDNGARLAENGEFSKRAFLNGKIDLSQAESIIDLINAKTISSVKDSYNQLQGNLKNKFIDFQDRLASIIASSSSCIDYPEEDLEEVTKKQLKEKLDLLLKDIESQLNSYSSAKVNRDGVSVAIVGEPNTGKSLLLNALLNKDRAIVSRIAGTTRDTIEDSFIYKDVFFTIVDTAGIRENTKFAEKEGIERTKKEIKKADILLCVTEKEKKFTIPIDSDTQKIFVHNKLDLIKDKSNVEKNNNKKGLCDKIFVSAKTKENINELKELLYKKAVKNISTDGSQINNLRQFESTKKAFDFLVKAIDNIKSNSGIEFIISDLNSASFSLAAVTGVNATEKIIDEIFKNFCVGK